MKDCIHGMLIHAPTFFKIKRHDNVEIHVQWCSEESILFILRIHLNLIVFQELIHEGHTSQSRMYYRS